MRSPSGATLVSLSEETVLEPGESVRSTQQAEVIVDAGALEDRWNAAGLACMTRAYWNPLTRRSRRILRFVRGKPGPRLVLLLAPVSLIRFGPPHHRISSEVAEVCWSIEGGLLVAASPGGTATGMLRWDPLESTCRHASLSIL